MPGLVTLLVAKAMGAERVCVTGDFCRITAALIALVAIFLFSFSRNEATLKTTMSVDPSVRLFFGLRIRSDGVVCSTLF